MAQCEPALKGKDKIAHSEQTLEGKNWNKPGKSDQ